MKRLISLLLVLVVMAPSFCVNAMTANPLDIKTDYIEFISGKDISVDEILIGGYFGSYNGYDCVLLGIKNELMSPATGELIIGNIIFDFGYEQNIDRFYLYKEGTFINVKDAYDEELIDSVDLFGIAQNFKNYRWRTAIDRPENNDYTQERFKDVDSEAWYEDFVRYVYEKNIMVGMNNDSFSPNTSVKREQVVQVLYKIGYGNISNPYAESEFIDVPIGRWYTPAVIWAHMHNVTNGISETEFGIGKDVTREQIAVFLMNYAEKTGIPTGGNITLKDFRDSSEISSWAEKGIAFCVSNGIIRGKGNNILDPKAPATRAEFAVMLKFFAELVEKHTECKLSVNGKDISKYVMAKECGLSPSAFTLLPFTATMKALGGYVRWESNDIAKVTFGDSIYRIDLNERKIYRYGTDELIVIPATPGSSRHLIDTPYELYMDDVSFCSYLKFMGVEASVSNAGDMVDIVTK